jgi:uncharacterized protein (TIGR02145 family)
MKKNISLILCALFLFSFQNSFFSQFNPKCEILKNKGNTELDARNYTKAIKFYTKAIEIDDQYYPAYYNRGCLNLDLNYLDAAIKDFNKCIEVMSEENMKLAQIYTNRGVAYKDKSEFEAAIADFNTAIAIDEELPYPYYNRSMVYQILEKVDLACEDFYTSMKLGMNDVKNIQSWCYKMSLEYFDTVLIGNQVWMADNLKVIKFNNGESISQVSSKEEWNNAINEQKPVWCYYNFDSLNNKEYGKLYNWYAVNDSRGLTPLGWHIPNIKEVEILENYANELPEQSQLSGKLKTLGFNPTLGGNINETGVAVNKDNFVAWWTNDEDQSNSWNKFGVGWYSGTDTESDEGKKFGFYVRCIKN